MKKRILTIVISISILLGGLLTWTSAYAAEPILWKEMEMSTYRNGKGGKEYYEHPTESGYVFAGWYQEKDGKSIAEDTVSGKAYAKFVKEEVLSFKGQLGTDTEVGSKSTYLRMVTSIDSLRYNQVGFKIKILDKTSYRWSTTAYDTLKGYVNEKQESYTPEGEFHPISEYFVAYRISNIPNSAFLTGITITPVWETLDGTTVEGVLRTVTVHEGIGEEASIVTVGNDEDRNHVYCTLDKPVQDGNTVTFDVNVEPSQEVEIYVLGEGSWNKEYFSEIYTISESQNVQAGVPENVSSVSLYAKFNDTNQDYSENIVEFKNIRIMGRMSSETDESVKDTNTSYGNVWSAPSTVKITQDALGQGEASLNYEAVRNEYESKQLIISASKAISNFELIAADLTSATGKKICSDNVEVYVEKYIVGCDDKVSDSYDPYGSAKNMPDALIPMEAAANYGENMIAANKNGALWVTIYVPEDTEAGTYSGPFQLVMQGADGKQTLNIPVSITVYNYTLSDESTAKTLFNMSYDRVATGELDGSVEMMTTYYEFFQNYRISLQTLPLESLSAEEFADTMAKYYDDYTTYSLLYKPGAVSMYVESYQEEVIQQVLAIAKKSGEDGRNYFEKAIVYSIDEPNLESEAGRNDVINRSAALYTVLNECVSIINQDTTGAYTSFKTLLGNNWENTILDIPSIIPISAVQWLCGRDYDDGISKSAVQEFLAAMHAESMPEYILCPLFSGYGQSSLGLYKNAWKNLSALQTTYGFELWWYGCIGPEAKWPTYHILDSNLLSARTVSWLQLKYNVSGNLYWDVAGYVSGGQYTDVYATGGNGALKGDGLLVYPGAAYGVKGPIPSMRLMSIRDGMEEYEMLKDIKNQKSYTDAQMFTTFYSKIADSKERTGNWDQGYTYVYETYISSMKGDENGSFDQLRSILLQTVAGCKFNGTDGISDNLGYDIGYVKEPNLLTQREYRNDIRTNLLFSFESYKDITGTAPYISGQLGKTSTNKSLEHISEGKGSWMIKPQGDYGINDDYPYVKLQCKGNSTFATSDFTGYDKLMLDIYNDSSEAVRIKWTLTVLDSEGKSKVTDPVYLTLQSKAWTTCEYLLSEGIYETYLTLDDVQYLTITFLTQKEDQADSVPTLYLDNLRGHDADVAREVSAYVPLFTQTVGFEELMDIYSFKGYSGSLRMNLSRISYAEAGIDPKDDSFGQYAMQGVATDAIWPKFDVNLDQTYKAGKSIQFWMYLDVDASVANGKTFGVQTFNGHKLTTSSSAFNQWVSVEIELTSDTNVVSIGLILDKGFDGWYSKVGKSSVHVYLDNFSVPNTLNPNDVYDSTQPNTGNENIWADFWP